MTEGILLANYGGVKKGGCIDGVASESYYIGRRVVDGQPGCRTTPEIIDELRIERRRPAERTSTIVSTLEVANWPRTVHLLYPSEEAIPSLVVSLFHFTRRVREKPTVRTP